ncbi:MAG: hypothetical protein DRP22_05120 [Verrucomicrobia bacterium]|nr:MAG: hypothetical protein DRP22_05120 [Verrucomicrobiota bacterium]
MVIPDPTGERRLSTDRPFRTRSRVRDGLFSAAWAAAAVLGIDGPLPDAKLLMNTAGWATW